LPIREYECNRCGRVFENLEIDVTDGNIVCPYCGTKDIVRKFSVFSSSKSTGAACDITRRYG
jgi:putative FmdB family regulatory protein